MKHLAMKHPATEPFDSPKSIARKRRASLQQRVVALSKQAASQIRPSELDPENQAIVAALKRAGLKLSSAWDGISGQIVNFKAGSLKAQDLRQLLQNPKVRWVAFDEDDAEVMGLKDVAGGHAGHWRFMRGPDFAAIAAFLTTHPILKYRGEFSVGC